MIRCARQVVKGPRSAVVMMFVKDPKPGKVKTRLAEGIGPRAAAAVYRRLAERAVRAVAPLAGEGVEVQICGLPPGSLTTLRVWLGRRFRYVPQRGRDLGARMAHAFREAFSTGARRAVIIGSDCPHLTTSIIRKALASLGTVDAVIGPAQDGGYYLIGVSKPMPFLFQRVSWGTGRVFRTTAGRLARRGLRWKRLTMLRDVDRMSDLRGIRRD